MSTAAQRAERLLRRKVRVSKSGGFISREVIVFELARFLERYYPGPGNEDRSVVDIGAGYRPYLPLYSLYFDRCLSTDVEASNYDPTNVDVLAPAESLPFEDASFEAVICTEVLGHCRDPRLVVQEIGRVLKPGGRAFLTTPFLHPLNDMPHDYHRFTPSALRAMSEEADLNVTSIVPRGDYIALTFLLLLYPLSKLLLTLERVTRLRLSHPANPLAFLALVLPQRAYLAAWRRARLDRSPRLRRIHEKLSYYALGYTTILERPQTS